MDVTVTARRCSVNEKTKEMVTQRTSETIERLQDRVTRAEVEFTANENKGNPDQTMRAEITLRGKGPVIRASAQGENKTQAFESALDKLKTQLRKAADRRKAHRGLRLGDLASDLSPLDVPLGGGETAAKEAPMRTVAGIEVMGDGPLIVREKEFTSPPLTLEQALDEMELVGHDFFLFVDATTNLPSVVYRRKAYDYGLIRLAVEKK